MMKVMTEKAFYGGSNEEKLPVLIIGSGEALSWIVLKQIPKVKGNGICKASLKRYKSDVPGYTYKVPATFTDMYEYASLTMFNDEIAIMTEVTI